MPPAKILIVSNILGVTDALLSIFLWAVHHFLCGYIAVTNFQTSMTTAVSMFVFSFGTSANKVSAHLGCESVSDYITHQYKFYSVCCIEAFGPELGYWLLALRLGSLVAYGQQ